jgi:hypothetical protein
MSDFLTAEKWVEQYSKKRENLIELVIAIQINAMKKAAKLQCPYCRANNPIVCDAPSYHIVGYHNIPCRAFDIREFIEKLKNDF